MCSELDLSGTGKEASGAGADTECLKATLGTELTTGQRRSIF